MEEFWIENIYNLIKDYSDLEQQKKERLGLVPNIVSSYDEMFNMLFCENDFEDFIEEWKKQGLDNVTLRELVHFRDMLRSYDNQFSPQNGKNFDRAILKDPNWKAVTEQAQKAIDVWKYESSGKR